MKEKSKQQISKDNYLKKKETFVLRVDIGKTELIDKRAEELNLSRNAYINKLIDDDINKD